MSNTQKELIIQEILKHPANDKDDTGRWKIYPRESLAIRTLDELNEVLLGLDSLISLDIDECS